jgi:DNA-binding MarR family transcriptional regulator
MDRKKRLEKAAKELADLIEKHLDGLSPSEREGKEGAFRRAVAKIGNSARSAVVRPTA